MYLNRRFFIASLAAAGGMGTAGQASPKAPHIVATTGMIADTARKIGQELVNVSALMGAGVDPHSYRQTRSDIVAMTRADLVLYNGFFLEAQMEEFLHKLTSRTRCSAVGQAIPENRLLTNAQYPDRYDPHVWMDPKLWTYVANDIRDQLINLMPKDTDALMRNASLFLSELQALDTYATHALASIPENARLLITAHDAFGYFGKAYGVEVMGIQGISTASESGLHRISELVDVLVDRQVKAIFVESSVSDRNVKALIEGAAARRHKVRIGGKLFSDAMGASGRYEGTYIGMIDHNVTTIARALGGSVPERGMNGRLADTGDA